MATSTPVLFFPHYRTISTQLSGLPIELVHKILSDIQLTKILALLSLYPNPYLDTCVSSHLDIRRLLPATHLQDIKRLFTVYLRVLQRRAQHRRSVKIQLLETDAAVLLGKSKGTNSNDVVAAIHVAISDELIERYARLLPAYIEYHQQDQTGIIIPPEHMWSSASVDDLEYVLDALLSADDALRRAQQQQLLKLAELIRKYHHMLKVVSDPSQESRTESHRLHLLSRYEHLASVIVNPCCKPVVSVFGRPLFPLIPYDRYLSLFYKTLRRYPSKSTHIYPPQLEIVLEGIKYVFPRSPPSDSKDNQGKDSTCPPLIRRILDDGHGGYAFNTCKSVCREEGTELDEYRTWPEAEFEWLEAFIMICLHMSEMQEMWYKTPGKVDTVADFWRKHLVN